MKSQLANILQEAFDKEIASSFSLFVGQTDKKNSDDLCLHLGCTSKNPLVQTNDYTLYDLASITKILGTTMAIAQAMIEKRFSLQTTPFIEWPNITIKNLLAHNAGFVAHRKFYDEPEIASLSFSEAKKYIYQKLFTESTSLTPTRIYCDLGFMLLGYLLESIYKSNLEEVFNRLFLEQGWVFKSFSSKKNSMYYPSVAPVGKCDVRKKNVQAQVHDLNCYYMGGLAGHAGLFGDILHVAQATRYFLSSYQSPQKPLQKVLRYFITNRLGFDHRTSNGSTKAFSRLAFGHFGFTGTSLWVDPNLCNKNGAFVVLLTNRVIKNNNQDGIFWLRNKIHTYVANNFY